MSQQTSAPATPATGTWELDPAHTTIGAVARHMVVSKVRGRFTSFRGTIEVAERPEDSRVDIEIDADSIDTANADRDGHLRSADFLDVDNYPHLTFTSTRITSKGDGRFDVEGELTIRGESRPVTLDAVYGGVKEDPWGNDTAFFSAETQLERENWGITWNQALESGGVLVGKKLDVELEVEAKPAG